MPLFLIPSVPWYTWKTPELFGSCQWPITNSFFLTKNWNRSRQTSPVKLLNNSRIIKRQWVQLYMVMFDVCICIDKQKPSWSRFTCEVYDQKVLFATTAWLQLMLALTWSSRWRPSVCSALPAGSPCTPFHCWKPSEVRWASCSSPPHQQGLRRNQIFPLGRKKTTAFLGLGRLGQDGRWYFAYFWSESQAAAAASVLPKAELAWTSWLLDGRLSSLQRVITVLSQPSVFTHVFSLRWYWCVETLIVLSSESEMSHWHFHQMINVFYTKFQFTWTPLNLIFNVLKLGLWSIGFKTGKFTSQHFVGSHLGVCILGQLFFVMYILDLLTMLFINANSSWMLHHLTQACLVSAKPLLRPQPEHWHPTRLWSESRPVHNSDILMKFADDTIISAIDMC